MLCWLARAYLHAAHTAQHRPSCRSLMAAGAKHNKQAQPSEAELARPDMPADGRTPLPEAPELPVLPPLLPLQEGAAPPLSQTQPQPLFRAAEHDRVAGKQVQDVKQGADGAAEARSNGNSPAPTVSYSPEPPQVSDQHTARGNERIEASTADAGEHQSKASPVVLYSDTEETAELTEPSGALAS